MKVNQEIWSFRSSFWICDQNLRFQLFNMNFFRGLYPHSYCSSFLYCNSTIVLFVSNYPIHNFNRNTWDKENRPEKISQTMKLQHLSNIIFFRMCLYPRKPALPRLWVIPPGVGGVSTLLLSWLQRISGCEVGPGSSLPSFLKPSD